MLSLSNKLSLTTQPIYKFVNKYSIDFDGSDDRIITDGADTVAQPTTYSFWCKSSTTGQNNGVFGHGSDRIGAFHFNRNADRPQLFLGTNYLVIWNDTSAQDDGEWHHWVVYADTNDVTNSKLYVDGVLQSQSFVNSSGSLNAYTESLTIGSERQVGGNSFEGKIDEFAVYDRELTQAEITKIYNSGSPINLNLNAGDYQSANPLITSTKSMEFDGTDDYLEVQDDSSLQLEGSEASWTFWTRLDSLSGGDQKFIAKATTTGGANAGYQIRTDNADLLFQFFSGAWRTVTSSSFFTDLNWVNVTITIDASNIVRIYKNGVETLNSNIGYSIPANTGEMLFGARTPSSPTNFLNGEMTEVGIWNRELTSLEVASLYNQGVPTDLLVSRGDYVATGLQGYWKMGDGTNDEYRIIFDQTNPTLGSELTVCGDFACANPDSAWSRGTGWTIANGVAEYDGSGGGNLDQTMDITNGSNYKVTFTILNSTQGILGVYLSGGFGGNFGNGTHTILIIGGSASSYDLRFVPISSFIGELDNVSVKEISGNPATMTNMVEGNITNQYPLTKIRNYYRMGDGILDVYPLIADQTNPSLGSEILSQPVDLQTDFVANSGGVIVDADTFTTAGGTFDGIKKSGFLTIGKTYKLTIDGNTTSSGFTIGYLVSGNEYGSGFGTHYFTATTSDLWIRQSTSGTTNITSFTIKQVNGNPGIMTNMSASDIILDTPNEPN